MLTVSVFCGPILVVASVRGASIFEPLVRLLHLEAVCFPTGVATRHNMSGSLAAVHTQNNSTDARGNLMFSGNWTKTSILTPFRDEGGSNKNRLAATTDERENHSTYMYF